MQIVNYIYLIKSLPRNRLLRQTSKVQKVYVATFEEKDSNIATSKGGGKVAASVGIASKYSNF